MEGPFCIRTGECGPIFSHAPLVPINPTSNVNVELNLTVQDKPTCVRIPSNMRWTQPRSHTPGTTRDKNLGTPKTNRPKNRGSPWSGRLVPRPRHASLLMLSYVHHKNVIGKNLRHCGIFYKRHPG